MITMVWTWLAQRVLFPFLPWILAGLLAAGAAGSLAAYLKGRADASARCQEAALRAELATLKRDMAAWRTAEQVEDRLQAELESELREMEKKVGAYEKELSERPDSKCALDQRDIDGLRGNRKR